MSCGPGYAPVDPVGRSVGTPSRPGRRLNNLGARLTPFHLVEIPSRACNTDLSTSRRLDNLDGAALFLNPGKLIDIKENDPAYSSRLRMKFNDVLEKIVVETSVLEKISDQADQYQNSRNSFGKQLTLRSRKTKNLHDFQWDNEWVNGEVVDPGDDEFWLSVDRALDASEGIDNRRNPRRGGSDIVYSRRDSGSSRTDASSDLVMEDAPIILDDDVGVEDDYEHRPQTPTHHSRPTVKTTFTSRNTQRNSTLSHIITTKKLSSIPAVISKGKQDKTSTSKNNPSPVSHEEPPLEEDISGGTVIARRKFVRRNSLLLKELGKVNSLETFPNIHGDRNHVEVCEYVDDIYQYYWVLEGQNPLLKNYMGTQRHITPQMCAILINWLVEVNLKIDLMEETFFLIDTCLLRAS
ncbi:hypothetical protein OROMI_008003 [Orobanche minor]